MQKLYRVLYSKKHLDCWNHDPVANSSHHHPPCQWIDRWDKHDKNSNAVSEANYTLECNEFGKKVMFTAGARTVFLAAPHKFTPEFIRENWDTKEIYEVGELDGVCAFTSPKACLEWIANDPTKKKLAHSYKYVVFEGNVVSEAPENNGMVAHILKKIGTPMTLDEFLGSSEKCES